MKGLKNKNTFSGGLKLPQRQDVKNNAFFLSMNFLLFLKKVEEGGLSLNRPSSYLV